MLNESLVKGRMFADKEAARFNTKGRGVLKFIFAAASSVALTPAVLAGTFADRLADLQPNQWGYMSTNSFMDAWPDAPQRMVEGNDGINGIDGTPRAVITAWSSFSWDSKRDQIILYGGGHANYPGNEIYLWDADSGTWGRGSLPSEIKHTGGVNYTAIDGADNAPIGAHTYDNTLYLPVADRYVTFGGAVYDGGGKYKDEDGNFVGPYFWDPSKADPDKVGGTTGSHIRPDEYPDVLGGEMWENRNKPLGYWNGHINGVTAYAQEGGKDVVYVGTSESLYKYTVEDVNNAALDHWTKVGQNNLLGGIWSQGAGALDAGSGLFVRTAGFNQFILYDLNDYRPGTTRRAEAVRLQYDVIGGTLDSELSWAGMDYDAVRDRFVVWDYFGQLWALTGPDDGTAEGWKLTLIDSLPSDILSPESLDAPDPTLYAGTGILGKWKYLSDHDVFLGIVNPDTGGVWAYKPGDGTVTVSNDNVGTVFAPATAWLMLFALGLLGRRLAN